MPTLVAPLRVLLVPDTRHWILGRIAAAIAAVNDDWIEATVVSRDVLLELLDRDGSAAGPFDLVHFVVPGAGSRLVERFAAMMPVATSMHHFDDTQPLDVIERGDAIAVAATQWRDWFLGRNWPQQRLALVPYGVDTGTFRPWPDNAAAQTRRAHGINTDAVVIGFVGKPAAAAGDRKGSDVFLDAIRRLGEQRANVVALLIGPGWSAMKRSIESAGVKCVDLPFVLDHADLGRLYAAMDLYWVTARIEGGPCTLLEAMSAGTCVVTTPVGMARDVVRDGENAVLVPIGDAEAVAAASVSLLGEPARRQQIGAAARATMLAGYDWTETARGVWELYRRAIEHWQRRSGERQPPRPLPPQPKERGHAIDWNRFHHAGIKPQWRSWLRAREDLLWMKLIAQLGATDSARRLAQRAVLQRPFDREVWRSVRDSFPEAPLLKGLTRLNGLIRPRK